jgi:hypothetical protein
MQETEVEDLAGRLFQHMVSVHSIAENDAASWAEATEQAAAAEVEQHDLPQQQQQQQQPAPSQHAEGSRNGLAGGFAGDLSQSSERLRCGPWIPTLAQSTVMCSLSKNRLLTADEMDMCMGWPTIVTPDNAVYASALGLGSSLEGASSMGRRRLAGNGMMMPQVMAWMLYIASHAVRKDRLEGLRLPLLLATVCDKAAESVDDSEDD